MSIRQYDALSQGVFRRRDIRTAPPVLPGVRANAPGHEDQAWRTHASCHGSDPELFFPIAKTGEAVLQIQAAKAVCASCPSRGSCLEFALATNQQSGIWGGTTEEERRRVRRSWLARRHSAS